MTRKWLARVIYVAAAILLLVGLMKVFSDKLVEHTIANSLEIDAVFRRARIFVDDWSKSHGQTPSRQVYENWAKAQPDAGKYYSVGSLRYWNENFDSEMVDKLGAPPSGSYVLSIWRGEWSEYCAGWSGKTTLLLRKSEFYSLGSASKDLLGSALIAFALILWGRRIGKPQLS